MRKTFQGWKLLAVLAAVGGAALGLGVLPPAPAVAAGQAPFLFIRVAADGTLLGALPPTYYGLVARLNGTPVKLGNLVSAGTSVNNHTTASAFNNTGTGLAGRVLLVQATAAGCLLPGTANDVAATCSDTGTGVELAAKERGIVIMAAGYGWMAWIASAAGNLKVWELL